MYRIVLACEGMPPELDPAAAIDISGEFTHRQWHQNVRCEWRPNPIASLCRD